MLNVSRDQIVTAFEELVVESQFQTAVDLLISADSAEQIELITTSSPALLHELFLTLDFDDRREVVRRLSSGIRELLRQTLVESGESVLFEAPTLSLTEIGEIFTAVAAEDGQRPAVPVVAVAPVPGRRDFAFDDGRLVESAAESASITVYSDPTGPAQLQLLDSLGIDDHTLASVLDSDEIARIEYDAGEKMAVIVWKRPRRGTSENPEVLRLSSVGLFLQQDHLTIVTAYGSPILRAGDRAESPQDVLLRVMSVTVNEFLVELNGVKRTSREIQTRLTKSIENRELLRMFNLSEGLVYHINAIDANGGVLRKIRAISPRLGFDEGNLELLEDIIIDNNQASRQGEVFSTVLAGMLDARGNIINNNMNVLLKNLTIVNVIFLPLGVIAGMGGMSEFSMMLDHYSVDWRVGYAGFTAGLTLLGLILLFIVSSFVNKKWRR